MTAIRPTESELRELIDADSYNSTLNDINAKYAEMDKYINTNYCVSLFFWQFNCLYLSIQIPIIYLFL